MLIYIYLIYWLEVLLGTLLEYMELKFFLFNFVEKSYEIFNIEISDFKLNQSELEIKSLISLAVLFLAT